MLYVGALASAFDTLVQTFNERVALIAFVCIILAGVIAVPIARLITQPITELVEANRSLAKGDMTVRVQPSGSGELGLLGRSFNNMAETLQHTQQELLHKERLASMGQLAAGVAHEINNPLGTILLYSDVLYKELPEDDPHRADLKMIIDETNRCKTIVSDLLNFARQHEVMAKVMNLHDLLDEVLKGLAKQPKFEGVRIEKKYDTDLPFIMADPDQLRQVFIILLDNAAEAIETRGTITIGTRPADEYWVEIRISDTGCGIAEENLNKDLYSILYYQAFRPGHRPGIIDCLWDHQDASRANQLAKQDGRRNHGYHHPANAPASEQFIPGKIFRLHDWMTVSYSR